MNYEEAAALFDVTPGTPIEVVRKRYLARVRVFHPDRHAAGTEAPARVAADAMAKINEAWNVYQQGPPTNARQSASDTPSAPPSSKPPHAGHTGPSACVICGWTPAQPVKLVTVQGRALLWRWNTQHDTLCRTCALTNYGNAQRYTLTHGWWGLLAPIPTIVAFLANLSITRAIKNMPDPQRRDPLAPRLSPTPLTHATGWYADPRPWVASGAALTIIAAIIAAAAALATVQTADTTPAATTGPTANPTTSPNPTVTPPEATDPEPSEHARLVTLLMLELNPEGLNASEQQCVRNEISRLTTKQLQDWLNRLEIPGWTQALFEPIVYACRTAVPMATPTRTPTPEANTRPTPAPSPTKPDTPPNAGTCWTGPAKPPGITRQVPCDAPTAKWLVTDVVNKPRKCVGEQTKWSRDTYLCLLPLRL